MWKIITTIFVIIDSVLQALGGTDENQINVFKRDGWSFNYRYRNSEVR